MRRGFDFLTRHQSRGFSVRALLIGHRTNLGRTRGRVLFDNSDVVKTVPAAVSRRLWFDARLSAKRYGGIPGRITVRTAHVQCSLRKRTALSLHGIARSGHSLLFGFRSGSSSGVERNLAKVEATSSRLVSRSTAGRVDVMRVRLDHQAISLCPARWCCMVWTSGCSRMTLQWWR